MSRQQGFSLIEVLVAMLVLGVAVLAFAGLQVRALESTGTAHTRSQAMTLASELIERMRANSSAMATYRDLTLYGADIWPAGEPSEWAADTCVLTVVNNDEANTGCSAVEVAEFDINEVQFLADQLLPAGRVLVDDCTGAGTIDCVFVSWAGVDPDDCVDNTTANCVAMRVYVR